MSFGLWPTLPQTYTKIGAKLFEISILTTDRGVKT